MKAPQLDLRYRGILRTLFTSTFALFSYFGHTQVKIGYNPAVVNPSAVLELSNNTSAAPSTWTYFMPPQVDFTNPAFTSSAVWGIAGSPTRGAMVYNIGETYSNGFSGPGPYFWEGNQWRRGSDPLYDVTSGLVAYYNFNGGNLNDSSGNGNNITFNNAVPTTDRFGHPNNAYLFNGTSSYMVVPNTASLSPSNITLMAIIKINGYYTGPCNGNQILGKGTPDGINGMYTLRFSDYVTNSCSSGPNPNTESFSGNFQAAGGSLDTVYTQTGTWYNVAFTYDGSQGKFYINGELKKVWNTTTTMAPNAFNLFIGRHEASNAPYWFNGAIDEIRIYNRPLPQGALQQLARSSY